MRSASTGESAEAEPDAYCLLRSARLETSRTDPRLGVGNTAAPTKPNVIRSLRPCWTKPLVQMELSSTEPGPQAELMDFDEVNRYLIQNWHSLCHKWLERARPDSDAR